MSEELLIRAQMLLILGLVFQRVLMEAAENYRLAVIMFLVRDLLYVPLNTEEIHIKIPSRSLTRLTQFIVKLKAPMATNL
jgi:hypothetical protein